MSNTYFQFKQFRIDQINSAMKVGTDGVLLGSWCNVTGAKSILDIGCGTGLISLMVAQRNSATTVTAIDISEHAIADCDANFEGSPWSNRLHAKHISLQDFVVVNASKFDLIICNPPFFNKSLKSDLAHKNLARHDDSLPFDRLFLFASKLLIDNGLFSIVIPHDRKEEAVKFALSHNLYLQRETLVYPKHESEFPKRSLLEFGFNDVQPVSDSLIIETERHIYSNEYRQLTMDFYLKF